MKKAVLYKKLPKKMVSCLACNFYCKIPNGLTGNCGVRENVDGDLHLLVYGKAVSVWPDPVEKKPLFHFLPGTEIFSIGTFGCNFGCEFCQNYNISQPTRIIKKTYAAEPEIQRSKIRELCEAGEDWPPDRIVEYCVKNGIRSVAYTYNEPAVFFEYAYDTAKLAHKKGLRNVFVSNGFESKEAIKKIMPYLDAINIDLKSFSEDFYRDICHAKLQPVLDNIKRCYKDKIWTEVTTLLIPGYNDSSDELMKIAKFIAGVSKDMPWHVTAFYPCYKMLDVPCTPVETLLRAYNIGKKAGLRYVYTGNIPGLAYENTSCPKCGEILIERAFMRVSRNVLRKGKCPKCKHKIAGIWE